MRKSGYLLAAAAAILVLGASLRAEVTRDQIDQAIERGVKALVGLQADDGHWPYKPGNAAAELDQYKVGHTALCVLALQHSGSRLPEVTLAMKKGMGYLAQQAPEAKTYTGGLIMQCFCMDGAAEHRKQIATYAWMLCGGQKTDGVIKGSWNYELPPLPPDWDGTGNQALKFKYPGTRVDNSNTQFGILGLVFAEKAGFQVPRVIWENARDYYVRTQHADGGWDYWSEVYRNANPTSAEKHPGDPTMPMTLAGTVSIYLCDEMLADKSHKQCITPAPNKTHEEGLKWIGAHWALKQAPYGWYACERLGMLIGYSEFGGHDWFQEGATELVGSVGVGTPYHGLGCDTSFGVLFLARGRNPIIINKLKRPGDWNLHRFDISHVIDHVSGPWQIPCQWRIVTLDAKVDFLLKVPILWISGHEALKFTPEEKAKLKEYVERGGTILAEDCCSKKPFDTSFRDMLKELWPDSSLIDLPKSHAIYTSFRKLENKPNLMGLALEKGQGRMGVIYIPNGISCRWEVGGPGSKGWLDVAACIYLYVDKIGKRIASEPAVEKPATPPADKPAADPVAQ